MSKPSILIVGATGNVGTELVSLLIAANIPVRALMRTAPAARHHPGTGLDIVYGDLQDKKSLVSALDGITTVFMITRDHPEQAQLEGHLIDAAIQADVKKMVKSSAFAAGLTPPVGYGAIHTDAEQQLMHSGLSWVILRPYMFMQNFLDLAVPMKTLGLMPLPMGRAPIGLIDARDVALVAQAVLTEEHHNNTVYDLTGPALLTVADCADIVSRVCERNVRYCAIPYWLATIMMRMQGVSIWDIAMRKQLFHMIRAGGEAQVTSNVRTITGKNPRSFELFVNDHRTEFE